MNDSSNVSTHTISLVLCYEQIHLKLGSQISRYLHNYMYIYPRYVRYQVNNRILVYETPNIYYN